MASVTISMPEPMKDWVDGQTDSGRYSDASDYVRDLIRRDQQRTAKIAHMQKLVDEGLASGMSDETMDDILFSLSIEDTDGRKRNQSPGLGALFPTEAR